MHAAPSLLLWAAVATAFPGRPPGTFLTVDDPEGRIRCHWERDEDETLCDDVLVWAGEAWSAQVDGLGFQAPLPDGGLGGSDALDIYLSTEAGGAGAAWVDCDGGDPNCLDADPSDGLAAAPSWVILDPRTPRQDLPHFVHHEFNHVLQYATDFAEPFLCLWEGTAVAAERWTDPAWSTIASDLGDYQATPWLSALLQDGYVLSDCCGIHDSWYEYGAVAWVLWMDERWGDGVGAIGPELWARVAQEGRGIEPDVLDAWGDLSGAWEDDLLAFAADRARMGTDAGPGWADFAGDLAYAARAGTVEALPADLSPGKAPYPLGMVYWDLPLVEGDSVDLVLDGDASTRWGWVVVEGAVGDRGQGDTLSWSATGDATLTIGVVNLGPEGMDADDPLEPADFVISIAGSESSGGCGCGGGGGTAPAAALIAAILALVRRRFPTRPAKQFREPSPSGPHQFNRVGPGSGRNTRLHRRIPRSRRRSHRH